MIQNIGAELKNNQPTTKSHKRIPQNKMHIQNAHVENNAVLIKDVLCPLEQGLKIHYGEHCDNVILIFLLKVILI